MNFFVFKIKLCSVLHVLEILLSGVVHGYLYLFHVYMTRSLKVLEFQEILMAEKMKIIIIIIIIIINYIYIARRLRNGKGTGILFFSFFCQCFMSGNVVCLVGLFQNKYPSAPFQERPVPRALPYVRFGCFFHWMFKTLMYSHFFWGVGYPMNDPSLTWSATWVFFL